MIIIERIISSFTVQKCTHLCWRSEHTIKYQINVNAKDYTICTMSPSLACVCSSMGYISNATQENSWNKQTKKSLSMSRGVFIFGTACQIYCYGRYCVRRSVSPQVPENPSGPLVDNFIVLPCVAFGVACVKLLPGVDRWNSLDDPRVIGPCHCEVWGWPRH